MDDRDTSSQGTEARESLAKQLALLSTSADLLEEKVSQMDGATESCQHSLKEASESFEMSVNVLDDLSQRVGQAATVHGSAFKSFSNASLDGTERLRAVLGKIEESSKTAIDLLDREKQVLESENAEALLKVNGSSVALSDWSGELSEIMGEMTETFSNLHAQYDTFNSTFDVNLAELEGDYDDISDAFSGDVLRTLGAAMSTVAGAIVTGSAEDIDEKVTGLDENTSRQFGEFDSLVDRVGEAIAEELQTMVNGLCTHVAETVSQEMTRLINDVVSQGISVMTQEVAEATVTTTVGSAVTATISPILPPLVAAKKALAAINAVKDSLFGG